MSADELIDEGRHLQRRTVLLTPEGTGERAAIWYGPTRGPTNGDSCCWLAVNAAAIPSAQLEGWLAVYLEAGTERGRVSVTAAAPDHEGISLWAKEISVLPPIEAVLWKVPEPAQVDAYERIFQREHPLYWEDSYATLGGWHFAWPDGDFYQLASEQLLIQTYKDCEPWIEVWLRRSGELEVRARIT